MSKTVFIVDDDADYVLQQKVRLEAAGYQVETAEGRGEAEKKLENFRPDIVVVDLMMEDMDGGFALAYHIKKKDDTIPVIIASGVKSDTGLEFDAATDEERSWVKADAFIAKPFRFEQLQAEIERLCK